MRLTTVLMGLALLSMPTAQAAGPKPSHVDAWLTPPERAARPHPIQSRSRDATAAHRYEAAGVPSFVWASKRPGHTGRFARLPVREAAAAQLDDVMALYEASSTSGLGLSVRSVTTDTLGTHVVTLEQRVDGLPVFRGQLRALLDRHHDLVAVSGLVAPGIARGSASRRDPFSLDAATAVSLAFTDLTGTALDASLFELQGSTDAHGYQRLGHASYARHLDAGMLIPARARAVFFPLADALVSAWYTELLVGAPDATDARYYAHVVSAEDGALLMRLDLTADVAFQYRVWADSTSPFTPHDGPQGTAGTPHPAGSPNGWVAPYVAAPLVSLQNVPFSQNDPWLPAGATVTSGNNVDAYADVVSPNGFSSGDVRGTTTAPGIFDRAYDVGLEPNASNAQIQAAVIELFFLNNWLHDWFYDAGFTESDGNAQVNNFGRGGAGSDPILAEAQDFGGTNNANMATPADGASPRMQMYIFDGPPNARLTVSAPAAVAGDYAVGVATEFGPQTFNLGGTVTAPAAADGPEACTALTQPAAVAGKIVLVRRGTCAFSVKAQTVQAAGAIGVLIYNNVDEGPLGLGGTQAGISIPVLSLGLPEGTALLAHVGNGLTAQLFRGTTIRNDGTLDNGIVAHEWGHYLSNRLVANGSGLGNTQGRSMGEGWGDFVALLMTVRAEDATAPSNPDWTGAFPVAMYASRGITLDADYYGIRRVPYSVDMEGKNALTFRHVIDGQSLPTHHPMLDFGSVPNAEVHNAGEVWTTALWECYVGLLRDTPRLPFAEAQRRMKSYLVAGLKLTPPNPTFIEGRDALLAAIRAHDLTDFGICGRAFARRGFGVLAVAADRASTTNVGAVENFDASSQVQWVEGGQSDAHPASCDDDGVLDDGETGYVTLTLRNMGWNASSQVSATVSTTAAGITFPSGPSVAFPSLEVGAAITAQVPVALSGVTGTNVQIPFTVTYRDTASVDPGDKTASFSIGVNRDDVQGTATTETVEADPAVPGNIPWTFTHDGTLAAADFAIATRTGGNHVFFGPAPAMKTDLSLVTPAIQVANVSFSVTFKHMHDFELSQGKRWDGAVVELSTNDGATWSTLPDSAFTTAGYPNGTIADTAGNPLSGKQGFTGRSSGWPNAFITDTINLGTTYQGQTIRLRFRIGTDEAVGAGGWLIDDVTVTGAVSPPFTAIVADGSTCGGSENAAPTANAGPDFAVDERGPVNLAGTASDPDGDTLTYAWTQVGGSPVVTLSGASTLSPSFTAPEVTANTVLTFQLRVSDGSLAATDTVQVTIRQVNRAPVVDAGPAASVQEGSAVTLAGTASDPDGQSLTLTWTQTGGPNVTLAGAATLTPSFTTPDVTADVVLTFALSASDGSLSATDTVAITVLRQNQAPVAEAGTAATVDERAAVTLSGTASDPDGDALTYAWTQTGGSPTVTLTGAGTLTPSFTAPEVTSDTVLTFRLSVSDGSLSASDTVQLTIRQVNRAPVADGGPAAAFDERGTVTLAGTASDPDGDALTYAWTQTGGSPTVTLTGANTLRPSFTAPEVTSDTVLTFRLSVSDGSLSASDTVQLTIRQVNRAPVVDAGAAAAFDERGTVLLAGTASDPDGDALTYAWTQTGGSPTVTVTGAGTLSPSFTAPEVTSDAVLIFRLSASDGSLSATDEVQITLRHVNRPPTVDAGPDFAAGAATVATLQGTGLDPDGDALTFGWIQTAGPTVTLDDAGTAQPTFTVPDVSADTTLAFQLVVTDAFGASASDAVTVTARRVNGAPELTAATTASFEERTTASLTVSGTDPDGDPVLFAWTQVDGPALTLEGADAATVSFEVPEVAEDTVAHLQVVASDGNLSSAPAIIAVTLLHVDRAPIATLSIPSELTVDEEAVVTLGAQAQDPDGEAVDGTWSQVSGPTVGLVPAGLDGLSATFTAPAVDAAGTQLVFSFVAHAGPLSSEPLTVRVQVDDVPEADALAVDAGTDQAVAAGAAVTLAAVVSNADGAVSALWTQTSGPVVTLTGADSLQAGFTAPEVPEDTELAFSVTVTDGAGASATDIVGVRVQGTQGPVVTEPGGCGCTSASSASGALLPLALLALGALRRRRS